MATKFSVCVWAYMNAIDQTATLMQGGGVASAVDHVNYGLELDTSEKLHGNLYDGSWEESVTTDVYAADAWKLCTVTYDGAIITAYLDEAFDHVADDHHDETATLHVPTAERAPGVSVGLNRGHSYPLNGYMENLAIFVQYTLSQAEITDIYDNFMFATENFPGRALIRKRAATEPAFNGAGPFESFRRHPTLLFQDPGIM